MWTIHKNLCLKTEQELYNGADIEEDASAVPGSVNLAGADIRSAPSDTPGAPVKAEIKHPKNVC